jgi:ABC-type bacteriocin/lantibiotic exporter with double-glycine peptidase domain
LEAISFGGIFVLIIVMLKSGDSLSSILPIITLYAFAGYRLMPALQSIYWSLTQIRGSGSSLDLIYSDLLCGKRNLISSGKAGKQFTSLKLNNIYFSYKGESRNNLEDVSIEINSGEKIGIVGETGSGKTTLIDIILGLLKPQNGQILINGLDCLSVQEINLNSFVGYVPQKISLIDSSIITNIAFGIDVKNVDFKAVCDAAKAAKIHEFIINLKDGYLTNVGEAGVMLSGGQRQRIGIARALYHSPKILILDEATSALDAESENQINKALDRIRGKVTVILIAHRLNTIQHSDIVFLVESGSVSDSGTFQDLIKSNEVVKNLAKLMSIDTAN